MHIYLRNVIDDTKAYATKGGDTSPAASGIDATTGTAQSTIVHLSINNPAATLNSTKATIGLKMKLKGSGGLAAFALAYLQPHGGTTTPTLTVIDDRSAATKTIKLKDIPNLKDDSLVFVVSTDILKVLAEQPQNKENKGNTYLSAPLDAPFALWAAEAAEHVLEKQKERDEAAEQRKETAAGKKRERAEGEESSTTATTTGTPTPVASTTPVAANTSVFHPAPADAEDGSSMDDDDDDDWEDEEFDDEDFDEEDLTDGSDAMENGDAEMQLLMDTIESFGLSLKGVQMLDKLLNLPSIDDMWAKFQTDPAAVMQEVQSQCPELFQLVTENHEEFLKIMEMRRKIKEDGLNVAHMMPDVNGSFNAAEQQEEDISDSEVTVRLKELVQIYKEEGIPSADGMTVTDMEGNVISNAADGDMFGGEFAELLDGARGGGGAGAHVVTEPLTAEDEEKIVSLMGLGNFTRDQCERALRRCEKNIERAASFLFENYTD